MSTKPKKSTATSRKRVTASARAKVSTKEIRKADLMHDGSFIQQTHPVRAVSTSSPTDLQPQVLVHESDSVLTILSQIQASNQELADRLEKLEKRQPDTFISAPTNSWSHQFLSQGTVPTNATSEHFTLQHQATAWPSQQSSIPQNTLQICLVTPSSLAWIHSGSCQMYLRQYQISWHHMNSKPSMSHCNVRTLVDQEDIIILTQYPTLQREDGPTRGTMAQMVRSAYYTMTSPCHSGWLGS